MLVVWREAVISDDRCPGCSRPRKPFYSECYVFRGLLWCSKKCAMLVERDRLKIHREEAFRRLVERA